MGLNITAASIADPNCYAQRPSNSLVTPRLEVERNAARSTRTSWSYGPKLIVVMVGLPARGKSYVSKKLARYFNWLQYPCKVFNAGEIRRTDSKIEPSLISADTRLSHSASFFNPDDQFAVAIREAIPMKTLDKLLIWLKEEGSCVGILDATNSSVKRRNNVLDRIRAVTGSKTEVLFLESVCTDPMLLENNIKLKLSGPDYFDQEHSAALADFRQRICQYERKYVSMGTTKEEQGTPYLQLINLGRRVVTNEITGFFSAQSVEYLLTLRLHDRQIWVKRNGESTDDSSGIIGRSVHLGARGLRFAAAFRKFIGAQRQLWESDSNQRLVNATHSVDTNNPGQPFSENARPTHPRFHVWTSMMQQTIEMGSYFRSPDYINKSLRMLNDLHAGDLEGMMSAQIEVEHACEMAARRKDPVYYRWPGTGGESYADVIHRLRPIILSLERMSEHILLITHRAVARVLLAYFKHLEWDAIAEVDVPPGRVFSVRPMPYDVEVESWQYNENMDDFYLIQN